jgi:hypothetical protein
MMLDENESIIGDNGETIRTSSVYTNRNGVESKKTVNSKKKIVNGKMEEVIT